PRPFYASRFPLRPSVWPLAARGARVPGLIFHRMWTRLMHLRTNERTVYPRFSGDAKRRRGAMARRSSIWTMVILAAAGLTTAQAKVQIGERPFGQMPDGRVITAFTLTNANGMKATLIELGATLVSLEVPDRDGNMADVVLG